MMKKDIKIFVSHRIDLDSEIINNPLYVPVRCGATFDERDSIKMQGDDTGDNISSKRMSFCELTVQYWAWKNVDADYYGLCHYRRYLSFSRMEYPEGQEESNNGCVVQDYINDLFYEKFGLNEDNMRSIIEKNDALVCKPIISTVSNYEAMKRSPDYHDIKDVKIMIDIIKDLYPDMSNIVDEYMNSNQVRLYNCFIMKKELFKKYSEWLFSILFELEKRIDMTFYGLQKYRTPGTIGERLFGIYCLYLSKRNDIKLKELQLAFVQNTEKRLELNPKYDDQVTIVSNFNNNYAGIFTCMLLSALRYIKKEKYYEFIVLSEDFSADNKKAISKIIESYRNVSVTYYNPFYLLSDINLFVNNSVYSKDLYVRVIIPFILENYKKVIVADVDIICKDDLSNLLDIDITGNSIAAVRDTVFGGYLNGVVPDAFPYCKKTLKLSNPYNYCNTGILIMDCEKIRGKYDIQYIKNHINNHQYRIFEQDMINVLFDNDIFFLEPEWNLFTYTNPTIEKCVKLAPFKDYQRYLVARENPKIIHFAAHPKPWWCSEADYGLEFWEIARKSPFYEKILAQMAWFQANGLIQQNAGAHNHCIVESLPRRISNIILPKGTRRREFVKRIVPKGSLIWNISKKIYYTFFSR